MMRDLASRDDTNIFLKQILTGDGGFKQVDEKETVDKDGKKVITRIVIVDGDLYLKAKEHVVKAGYGPLPQEIQPLGADGEKVSAQVIVFGGVQVAF